MYLLLTVMLSASVCVFVLVCMHMSGKLAGRGRLTTRESVGITLYWSGGGQRSVFWRDSLPYCCSLKPVGILPL